MLDYQATLEESRGLEGGLGAIVFATIRGLRESGAEPNAIAEVNRLLNEHFARLSDEDCHVLCAVVAQRLDGDKNAEGRWY